MKNAKPLLLGKIGEMFGDALLLLLAFAGAYVMRIGQFHSSDFPFPPYMLLALYTIPAFILFLAWSGLYSLTEKSLKDILRMTSFSALAGSMLFVLIFFFQREIFFSRGIILLIFLLSTFFLFFFHAFLQQYRALQYKNGKQVLRTLIIGNGTMAKKIIAAMHQKGSRLQPVAILAPYGGRTKSICGVPVMGKLDALEKVVKEKNIDAIVQTEAGEQILNLFLFAEGNFLEFHLSPSVFGVFRNTMEPHTIAGFPFLRYTASPLFGWGQVYKRLTDVVVGSMLFLFASPLLAAKTIVSKPMATGTGDDVFYKYEFLYGKGAIKYIPEIIHVLKGEMSLIGPRPRSPKERDELKLHERRRLLVKPGIFGMAQLEKMKRGEITKEEEIELDTEYIFGWRYKNDMRILGKSILQLFRKKYEGGNPNAEEQQKTG